MHKGILRRSKQKLCPMQMDHHDKVIINRFGSYKKSSLTISAEGQGVYCKRQVK